VKPRTRKSSQGRHRAGPDPLAKLVGARIRELRLEAEFTFDAFVEETGLGRGYVSELERGKVVPTVGTLAKVASALDLTLADLVAIGDTRREELFRETRELDDAQIDAVLRDVRKMRRPRRSQP
jgi:transcriptional regulator with XRE-family HTH domain